jgi:flagellar motility protein MotE (MotC chaperone)
MKILIGAALVFFLAVSAVIAADKPVEKPAAPTSPAESVPQKSTPIALTAEAIQELETRKNSLDAREKELAEKAKALEVQEKVILEKLKKMEELNKRMADRLDGYKKEHDQKITKLVTVVENMRPQAAAEYVENLDPDLAVEILSRIQIPKAAKIMNLVDKRKSARLTELYTGYRNSITDPVPAALDVKKEEGENKTTKL